MKENTENLTKIENAQDFCLNEAKKLGATDAEVSVSSGSGITLTTRLGDIESLEHQSDQTLTVNIFVGERKGASSTTDLSETALLKIVDSANTIANVTSEDSCNGIPEKELFTSDLPNLDLYHPWELTTKDAYKFTNECESSARENKSISNSEGSTISSYQQTRSLVNTNGFSAQYKSSIHSLTCSVIASDKGNMQRDYWFTTHRDPKLLNKFSVVGKVAADRAARRLNSRKIKTCRVPVLFDSLIAKSIFSSFVSAITGSAIYKRTSFLTDALEKQIFPDFLTITEKPHIKKALGSAPFDAEGVATSERELVMSGVLHGYILDCYSARRLNMQTTANSGGIHNLIIQSKENCSTTEEIIKNMKRGLFVTELIGHGVNLVTGDYSRGASGYWVENGEIQHPVEEITVAGNLESMFKNIIVVSSDADERSRIISGAVLIDDLMVAGQ